jgi:hypothetical protein
MVLTLAIFIVAKDVRRASTSVESMGEIRIIVGNRYLNYTTNSKFLLRELFVLKLSPHLYSLHTYIHKHIHAYIQQIHAYTHTYTHIHTHLHAYIHTHTYIHTYMHAYMAMGVNPVSMQTASFDTVRYVLQF